MTITYNIPTADHPKGLMEILPILEERILLTEDVGYTLSLKNLVDYL